MLKEHIYQYDHITIGNNLNAIIYAYKKGGVFINNAVAGLFPYDTILHAIDLGIRSYDVGSSPLKVYEDISYLMAMEGRHFLSNAVESIFVNLNESELSVSSKFFRPKKLRYSSLTVFDLENVNGLPFDDVVPESYRVYDWFAARSGGKHDLSFLESNTDFVRKVHFFTSPRIAGNKSIKDFVAESILTKEQVNDVDYSNSLARLKCLRMLEEAGIKGAKNGIGKHLSLKVDFLKRDVFPIKKYSKLRENNVILENLDYSEI
mgnify:FL=1